MEPLRITSDILEICDTFKKIYADGSSVLVWQPSEDGQKRNVIETVITTIDFNKKCVVLVPKDEVEITLGNQGVFYVWGAEKSVLFKDKNLKVAKNSIVLKIPPSVRMIEKRSYQRFHVGEQAGKLALVNANAKLHNVGKASYYPIYDISYGGICLHLPLKDGQIYLEDETIEINQLNEHDMPNPIRGKIVYIKKVEYRIGRTRKAKLKMGIQFLIPVSYEIIKKVLNTAPSHKKAA